MGYAGNLKQVSKQEIKKEEESRFKTTHTHVGVIVCIGKVLVS
jgi:hypothetical protein